MPIRIISAPAEHVSAMRDVAGGAHTGLVEGISGLVGQVGDMQAFGSDMTDKVAEFAQRHGIPMAKPSELQKYVPLSAGQMLGAVGAAAAHRMGADPGMGRLATSAMIPGATGAAPTSQDVQRVVTHDKPLYQPQTGAGKIARTGAQWSPAALMPGTAGQRLAAVIAPTIATEGAGRLTKGSPLEPYARTAAGIVSSVGAGMMGRPPGARLLADASRNATDEQIAAAQALMQRAQAEGVRLTVAEALQQVTNGGTGMGRLQRVVEGTRAGSERIAPVMAERPGQVRQAVGNVADTVAPPTDQPSMIGAQAQTAAEAGLSGVRQHINAAARPHYEALAGQPLPDAEFRALSQNPTFRAALAELRSNPELNGPISHLPDNDLSVINEVQKRIQGMAEAATPNPANPAGNNQLAAIRNNAAGQVNGVASAASPDWRAARDTVAMGRQEHLEPLQQGPLGAIASTADTGAQARALYPSQPLEGAAAETRRAVEMLQGEDPTVGPALTRQHLMSTMNEATQDNLGGPNQWGGAKFAATIAGNPEQGRALTAGVEASGGDAQRLASVLDALRATGYRERPGSMTAYNNRDIEELGKAGMAGEVLRTGLNPPGVFRRIGQGFQDWQTERNAGRLADAIIAEPDEAVRRVLAARRAAPGADPADSLARLVAAIELSHRQDPAQLSPPGQ